MFKRSFFARRAARFAALFAVAVLASLVAGAAAQAAPPANDAFATAASLGTAATGSITGADVDATFETGESSALTNFGTSGDVWYSWTAPSDGFVAFRTTDPGINENLDTVLAAQTGSDVTALTTVDVNDDYPGCCTSRIVFDATAGTTYYISVGAFPSDPVSLTQGEFGLEWGNPDLYDVDLPVVQLGTKTSLKHGFRLTFSTGDKTGNIVGGDWVTTECKLDGGPFQPCTSPWVVSGVAGGKHTWTIRATDKAGNVGSLSGTARAKGSSQTTG
jgi:hypothetical protein